ncbi:hypothetical protein LCGC14_2213290 [marine sediment metagenome]|uniref:LamG-like jellyroll fold domain-containing protein n=1 Tax=marine sediment metagenome TaxID=412755 RepID=A0A0F9E0L9_9ZZZZ
MTKRSSQNLGILLVVLMCLGYFTTIAFFSLDKSEKLLNIPRTSANEIIVITPENKIYSEPMSGYYPATYGFENEVNGTGGTDITFVDYDGSSGAGYLSIVPKIGNHEKVLKSNDGGGTGNFANLNNNFSSIQNNGTVEYWMNTEDAYYQNAFIIRRETSNNLCGVRFWEDQFQVLTTGGWSFISGAPTALDNTWYHIRIDFESTSGLYMGLAQYNSRLFINGDEYGPYAFESNVNDATEAYITTQSTSPDYNMYLDAVSYSWDDDYNIGDNLNEGLLLSYENSTNLDWQGYSLDGQANTTILGNTTIPMPADGPHSIQVFGNNSGGVMYESDIRYFTVDTSGEPPSPYINIITPENRTYTEPMSNLSLSFESNINLDWIGYSLDGQINITISGNTTIPLPADGHHIIQLFGNDSLGVNYESNIRYFAIDILAPIISGIEFIIELELYSYYTMHWDIIDISGGTYIILKNSSIVSAGSFQNNDVISINVDTIKLGYLNYTLIAQDLYNKTSSHTVIVKIISQEQPDSMIPGFNVLFLFTVALITIGIIIKFKFKNKK